jgi:hypothetical protein
MYRMKTNEQLFPLKSWWEHAHSWFIAHRSR